MAEKLPARSSWINKLTKAEVIDFCGRFALMTNSTLDGLRKVLRDYVHSLDREEDNGSYGDLIGNVSEVTPSKVQVPIVGNLI